MPVHICNSNTRHLNVAFSLASAAGVCFCLAGALTVVTSPRCCLIWYIEIRESWAVLLGAAYLAYSKAAAQLAVGLWRFG